MSKWNRLIGIGLLTSTLLVSNIAPLPVQASSILDKVTISETMDESAEDTSYSRLKGNNLNLGRAKITKLASNKVNVYGLTQCHHECDEVYLYLYLERKVNGSYGTYKFWKFDKTDASNLTASIDVIVPSGSYYRVRGYHAAKDGSKESTTTLTSGILVK